MVEVAGLQPDHVAGDVKHTRGDAVGAETVDQPTIATLPEEAAKPHRVVKAGDSFAIPAGKVHDAKVIGDKPVKVLATYIIEKGKPLATPAP